MRNKKVSLMIMKTKLLDSIINKKNDKGVGFWRNFGAASVGSEAQNFGSIEMFQERMKEDSESPYMGLFR